MEKQTTTKEKVITKPKNWEIKNRHYYVSNGKSPLVFTVPTKHTTKAPLLWYDPEKGYQRELRYATNQASVFVDEQEGEATLGHIIFRNGILNVPKEKQNLQVLLSKYHPYINNTRLHLNNYLTIPLQMDLQRSNPDDRNYKTRNNTASHSKSNKLKVERV